MMDNEFKNPQICTPRNMYEAFIASVTQSPSQPAAAQHEGYNERAEARFYVNLLCIAYNWKMPVFECYEEETPNHKKLFTCKLTITSEDGHIIVESFGKPQMRKRSAERKASEGAVWYLKHIGAIN